MKKTKFKLSKSEFKSGKEILNAWLTIPSAWSAEIIASTGIDAITIDMQHGYSDFSTTISILQSTARFGCFPLVRVPWNDPAIIMRTLDAGAMGIICPMINTKSEAKKFVESCKYPPMGQRSWGPLRPNLNFDNYLANANDLVVAIAMIETKEGLNNLDEILSVEGLDGIYIGSMDLSISLGLENPGNLSNNELSNAIQLICRKTKDKGLFVGMHTSNVDEIKKLKSFGINLITILNDSRLLQAAAIDTLKSALIN